MEARRPEIEGRRLVRAPFGEVCTVKLASKKGVPKLDSNNQVPVAHILRNPKWVQKAGAVPALVLGGRHPPTALRASGVPGWCEPGSQPQAHLPARPQSSVLSVPLSGFSGRVMACVCRWHWACVAVSVGLGREIYRREPSGIPSLDSLFSLAFLARRAWYSR